MRRGILLVAALVALAAAGQMSDWHAVEDSLRTIEPLLRPRWLAARGLLCKYGERFSWKPDSLGLSCVGRWSYGPSVKVSLRATVDDTIVCLTRGSGASLIRFRSQGGVSLDLLSDIDCEGMPCRAITSDSLVVAGIGGGGTGLEVYGVADLAEPHRLSRVDLPVVCDVAVNDSLVYVACADESLRIYSIADPRNPVRVGACRDSCDLMMAQAGDHCYLVHWSGVNILDVSNPAIPHRVGRIGGCEPMAVYVRDTLCFLWAYEEGLRVFDVSDPTVPREVGSLAGTEPWSCNLYMAETCDTLLFTPELEVICVADPTRPRLLGQTTIPGREYGVRAVPALNYVLVADRFDGVVAVDVTNPSAPRIDTMAFAAGSAEDIFIDGDRAYVGTTTAGLSILDIADPAQVQRLGLFDYPGIGAYCPAAVAHDSLAFVTLADSVPQFRTMSVTDPHNPTLVGGCNVFAPPQDLVLRDSLVFAAEVNRFQVVNVARPREPELVGSCELPFDSWKVLLRDTLAFVANVTSLKVINVVRPDAPQEIGSWSGRILGMAIRDTLLFTASSYYGCKALSIADPRQPRLLDSVALDGWMADVVVVDTLAYVGGSALYVVNTADPENLCVVGSWVPPQTIRRLVWEPPYLYVACCEAGVCVLESLQTGLQEADPADPRQSGIRLAPSVTAGPVELVLPARLRGYDAIELYDAAGSKVMEKSIARSGPEDRVRLDLSQVRAGVYVVSVRAGGSRYTTKVVKTTQRR